MFTIIIRVFLIFYHAMSSTTSMLSHTTQTNTGSHRVLQPHLDPTNSWNITNGAVPLATVISTVLFAKNQLVETNTNTSTVDATLPDEYTSRSILSHMILDITDPDYHSPYHMRLNAYGRIQSRHQTFPVTLDTLGVTFNNAKEVADAVIAIRHQMGFIDPNIEAMLREDGDDGISCLSDDEI